jgi:hypothetical protein
MQMDPQIDDFDSEVQCEEVYAAEGDDLEGDDPWDGDWEGADAEVLANAGMGTDEDYGYFGDRDEW